jgi:hypothetical protein
MEPPTNDEWKDYLLKQQEKLKTIEIELKKKDEIIEDLKRYMYQISIPFTELIHHLPFHIFNV